MKSLQDIAKYENLFIKIYLFIKCIIKHIKMYLLKS